MRRACLLAILIALACGSRAPSARSDEGALATRWASVRGEVVERLHGLAKWCTEAKLFGARAEVYAGILRFDPDDAVARKRLKYVRAKDGSWVRKANWKPPKNLSRLGPEFRAKRSELGTWFAGEVQELFDEAEAERAYRVRGAIVQSALGVDPERAAFRAWNHEVKDAKAGWILAETERARERRAGIRKTAAEAIEAVEAPETGSQQKADRVGGVDWQTILEGKRVRLVTTTEADENQQILRNMEACWPVFHYALDRVGPTYRPQGRYVRAGWTTYIFGDNDVANAFYGAQPHVTARQQEFTKDLVGTWIPKRTAAIVKSSVAATRIEVASKQVMSALNQAVLGLNRKRAWAAEGLTLYLNYQIVGTRMIYSVNDVKTEYAQPEKGIPEHERRMADADAVWLELGRLLLESPDKPDIFLMSGKDYNTLTRAEMLFGYCTAAYVVEGWPAKAAEFFQTVSSEHGTDLDRACLETFGFDARTFEARLLRWLTETAGV